MSTSDLLLQLIKNVINTINPDPNPRIVNIYHQNCLKQLSCNFPAIRAPSSNLIMHKFSIFFNNQNNSANSTNFENCILKLNSFFDKNKIDIFLRFFLEFTKNLDKPTFFVPEVDNPLNLKDSHMSIMSFKSISPDKFSASLENLNRIASVENEDSSTDLDVKQLSFSESAEKMSRSFCPIDPKQRTQIFNKDVISTLELNSHRSPWLLISDKLPEGQREFDMVSDLIFVLQGIDGLYIKFDPSSQRYVLNPKCDLSSPVKQIIYRICEIGYLFRQLNDINIHDESDSCGMVKKAFNLSVKSHLNDFIRKIASIDIERANSKENFDLTQLLLHTLEYRHKFIYLYNASKKCQGLTGGSLLSTIYSFSLTGDPFLSIVGQNLLIDAAKPLNRMLTEWINEGNLTDPFNEFFITVDNNVKTDKFWMLKYHIRTEMIPNYIPDEIVNKILRIGKSINFMKQICGLEYHLETHCGMLNMGSDSEPPTISNLSDTICQIESKINKYVLSLMYDKYHLKIHLRALFRYLMLAQGDFIRQLLELLEPFLSASADQLRLNNMTSILESAINSSNAQFDSKEALKRLDCKLAQKTPGDLGWDIFTLYYHTRGPLQIVVDNRSIEKYLKIFRFLWFMKRLSHLMDSLSKDQILRQKDLRNNKESSDLMKYINLVKYEMHHFIKQLEYFLTFEVLECSRAEFKAKYKKATDLDHIIKAHELFLNDVVCLCFMNEESEIILFQLHEIFKKVLNFEAIYRNSVITIATEIQNSSSNEDVSSKIHSAIKYTVDKLTTLLESYRSLVIEFLQCLMTSSNPQHYFLAFRLDFNEFYMKKMSLNNSMISFLNKSQIHQDVK